MKLKFNNFDNIDTDSVVKKELDRHSLQTIKRSECGTDCFQEDPMCIH